MAMEIQKLIDVLSKKTGKEPATLKVEVDGFYTEAKTLYPGKDEKFLMDAAIESFTASYRKKLASFSSGTEISAVFIGYSDFNQSRKLKADILAEYKKNPIVAFHAKMVNDKGEPLYWALPEDIAKMEDWQKKKLGEIIPDNDIRRTVNGVTIRDDKMVEFELTLGNTCWDKKIELFKSVKFAATEKALTSPNLMRMYGTKNIEFIYGEPISEVIAEKILIGFLKNRNMNFSKIPQFAETEAGKKFGAYIVNKVKVVDISPVIAKNGQRMIRVQDESMDIIDEKGEIVPPIRCFVPAEIPVDYTERATIYAIGKVTMDKQTGKYTTMNIFGIYTPETFKDLKKSLPVESEPTAKKPEDFDDAF